MTATERFRLVLDTIGTIALVAACGFLISRQTDSGSATGVAQARGSGAETVNLETTLEGALQGVKTAKLALIEFADFQCPFCQQFLVGAFPELKRQFIDTGKVQFAYRHYPLHTIHPFAVSASKGAECAGVQNKYWKMHDSLFANYRDLSESKLLASSRTFLRICLSDLVTPRRDR